ncbi:MAG: hypothetical protein K2P58_14180 [Hyphomonadaceae bacterium]|nr:hypothetical protein [Hyphomonadaceae bacterium]
MGAALALAEVAPRASNDNYNWIGPTVASRAYTRNGLNQYSNVGGTAHAYDLRGNLINDGTRSFCYDLENRLIAVAAAAAVNCASPTLSLAYDPLGRVRQSAAGGVTTDFLYDGDALVAEYNGATLLRRYAHGAADSTGALIGAPYRYGPYGEPDRWAGARFRYTGQMRER